MSPNGDRAALVTGALLASDAASCRNGATLDVGEGSFTP